MTTHLPGGRMFRGRATAATAAAWAPRPRRRAAWHGLAWAGLLGLAACGGGEAPAPTSAAPEAAATAASAPPASARRISVPEYLAQRAATASAPAPAVAVPEPSAAERAQVFDASLQRAIELLRESLEPRGNAMALPPLSFAFVNTAASAAWGDTLAQLLAAYPPALGPYAAAQQTQGVERELWAAPGATFDPGFLDGTDALGAPPRLAAWSAQVAAPNWGESAAFNAAIVAQGLDSYATVPRSDAVRLFVVDTLRAGMRWRGAESFEGLYQGETGGLRQLMPMLRLTQGVKRHQDGVYTADALALGEQTLIVVQPRSRALFLSQHVGPELRRFIADAVRVFTAPTLAALPDGQIVLPVGAVPLIPGGAVPRGALWLAFDEQRADFRKLDGGGTYLSTEQASQLDIDAGGLALRGTLATRFVFSPRNVYAPGDTLGGVFTWGNWNPLFGWPSACPRASDDLGPHFVLLLDRDRRVSALAGVSTLPGETRCY